MYTFHIFAHKFSEMYTMQYGTFIGKYFEIFLTRILKFLTHKSYIKYIIYS